jgi:hypothetical protein
LGVFDWLAEVSVGLIAHLNGYVVDQDRTGAAFAFRPRLQICKPDTHGAPDTDGRDFAPVHEFVDR